MNEQTYNEIDRLLSSVAGDIIDFRVYKGASFAYMAKLAIKYDRHAIGLDTFTGLGEPTKEDKTLRGQSFYPKGYAKSDKDSVIKNVKRVCGEIDPKYVTISSDAIDLLHERQGDRRFAYAHVDLLHFHPTIKALNYLLNRMEPGGVIECLNYREGHECLASRAIDQFLTENAYRFTIIRGENTTRGATPFYSIKLIRSDLATTEEKFESQFAENRFTGNKTSSKHTIALVLRTGGDTYNYKYVNALARNLKQHLTIDHRIVVLTDNNNGIDSNLIDDTVPFIHPYKGWWGKIELFRPNLFSSEQVLYLDLDTVITSNIDDIVQYKTTFAGIKDLYDYSALQTGIMSWNPDYNHQVYENFIPVAHNITEKYNLPSCGDARWIRENVHNYEFLQPAFPGRIVSYKAHCFNKNTGKVAIPPDASIICFHGKPRPHTIKHPQITKHWKYE